MDELKETIAKNLVELRTASRMTQLQLAEKLNYSDKAVSKWERGEAIPDIRVLKKLSEIYNISVDDIISESVSLKVKPKMNIGKKRLLITLLSAGLVWFIATVIFMIVYFIPESAKYAYLVYVCAPFCCAIVITVFSAVGQLDNEYGRLFADSMDGRGNFPRLRHNLFKLRQNLLYVYRGGGFRSAYTSLVPVKKTL